MDATRRAFLAGACLTQTGREGAARQQQAWGPNPPGLADIDQVDCTGCGGSCVQACGESIIRRYPAGHVDAHRPYLDFSQAGCTFYAGCHGVCPSATPISHPTEPIGMVQIDTAACLAHQSVICMACVGSCPTHTIRMNRQHQPGIDPARCTGCGLCVPVCPGHAIHVIPLQAQDHASRQLN